MDFGGADGDRTHDLSIANAALSQLSYGPEKTTERQREVYSFKSGCKNGRKNGYAEIERRRPKILASDRARFFARSS